MITCIDYFAGIGAWELAAEILEQIYGYQVFTTYQFVEIPAIALVRVKFLFRGCLKSFEGSKFMPVAVP
jgi:hypothetical protein